MWTYLMQKGSNNRGNGDAQNTVEAGQVEFEFAQTSDFAQSDESLGVWKLLCRSPVHLRRDSVLVVVRSHILA